MYSFSNSHLVDKVSVIPLICGVSLVAVGIMPQTAHAVSIDVCSIRKIIALIQMG